MRLGLVLAALVVSVSAAAQEPPGYIGVLPQFDGLYVAAKEVVEDSPAGDADILVGDRVLTVDGYYPTSEQHFRQLIAGPPGKKLTLLILRPDGTKRTVELVKRVILDPLRPVKPRATDLVVTELAPSEQVTSVELGQGRARATGRVLLDGKPWERALIAVRLYRNDRRTAFAMTGKDGMYAVSIPTGTVPVLGFWLQRPPSFEREVLLSGPAQWSGVECGKGKSCRLPDVEVATGMELTAPAPGALLAERKVAFAWKPVEGAAGYELTVRPESGGAQGLSQRTAEPGYCCFEVPDDRALPRHGYFRWTVDALSSTGRRLSTGEGTFVLKRAR